MKKEDLLKEIVLRLSRLIIVILFSFLLYSYLKDFIKRHEEIIVFIFVISSILIFISMKVIKGLYFVLKKILLGNQFDNKDRLIVFSQHFLIILMFIFFVIHFYPFLGDIYTVLVLLGIEIWGLLNSIYDTDSNNKDEIIENKKH